MARVLLSCNDGMACGRMRVEFSVEAGRVVYVRLRRTLSDFKETCYLKDGVNFLNLKGRLHHLPSCEKRNLEMPGAPGRDRTLSLFRLP